MAMTISRSNNDMFEPDWLNKNRIVTHPYLSPSKSNIKDVNPIFWDAENNPSDGFCFYHAVLRYIYKSGTNDQKQIYTPNYKPSLELKNKQSNYTDIVNLLIKFNDYLLENKKITQNFAEALQKNIKKALKGKGTTIFAGDANINEFRDMAEMLGICILIWRFVPTNWNDQDLGKWVWQKEGEAKCTTQNTMYIFNVGRNHMISLFPKLQRNLQSNLLNIKRNMYLPPSNNQTPDIISSVVANPKSLYIPSKNEEEDNFIAQMKIYFLNINNNIKKIDDEKLRVIYRKFNEDNNFGFEDKTEDFINEFILKLKEKNQFGGKPKRQRVTKRHERQQVTKRTRQRGTKRTRTKRQRRALVL